MKLIRSSAKEAASFRWFLVLLVAAAAVQMLLPDPFRIRCLFKEWSGHPCPTCGATSCLQRILHGEWTAAWLTQPLVFTGFLGLGTALIYSLAAVPLKLPTVTLQLESRREKAAAALLAIILVAANWIYLLHQKPA